MSDTKDVFKIATEEWGYTLWNNNVQVGASTTENVPHAWFVLAFANDDAAPL